MNTTRSTTEIWLIGNPKSDFNTGCLLTNGDVKRYFFLIFKTQNDTTIDAVKLTIEAVPVTKYSTLHSKQLMEIF